MSFSEGETHKGLFLSLSRQRRDMSFSRSFSPLFKDKPPRSQRVSGLWRQMCREGIKKLFFDESYPCPTVSDHDLPCPRTDLSKSPQSIPWGRVILRFSQQLRTDLLDLSLKRGHIKWITLLIITMGHKIKNIAVFESASLNQNRINPRRQYLPTYGHEVMLLQCGRDLQQCGEGELVTPGNKIFRQYQESRTLYDLPSHPGIHNQP